MHPKHRETRHRALVDMINNILSSLEALSNYESNINDKHFEYIIYCSVSQKYWSVIPYQNHQLKPETLQN